MDNCTAVTVFSAVKGGDIDLDLQSVCYLFFRCYAGIAVRLSAGTKAKSKSNTRYHLTLFFVCLQNEFAIHFIKL